MACLSIPFSVVCPRPMYVSGMEPGGCPAESCPAGWECSPSSPPAQPASSSAQPPPQTVPTPASLHKKPTVKIFKRFLALVILFGHSKYNNLRLKIFSLLLRKGPIYWKFNWLSKYVTQCKAQSPSCILSTSLFLKSLLAWSTLARWQNNLIHALKGLCHQMDWDIFDMHGEMKA